MIPFLDLKGLNAQYRAELIEACTKVIDSGWYVQGNECNEFEKEFAEYCGTKYAIGVANGLDALILILRAYKEMGIMNDGDEVIVPSNTYIASILAISQNNLVPVLVEPDINTFLIDPDIYLEDWDYAVRCVAKNLILFYDEKVAAYRLHENNTIKNKNAAIIFSESCIKTIEKHSFKFKLWDRIKLWNKSRRLKRKINKIKK